MSKNDLPSRDPQRIQLATVTEAPNTYLQYPAYGEVYTFEFDIDGKPLKYGFRAYRCDGQFAAMVELGLARDVKFTPGFVPGARIASLPRWLVTA